MKVLIIIFFALFLAAVLGLLVVNDTGYILVTISDWTIQTSLVFFLALIVFAFTLIYFIVRLVFRIWDMPALLRVWRKQKRQTLAEKYLTRGLLALVEGRWKSAEHELIKGVKYTSKPLINYLCAARAAQWQGKMDYRDYYLQLANVEDQKSKMAIGLTQAELQISGQQTEHALATLMHLNEQQPNQRQVKLLLLKTYSDLKSWRDILNVLPDLERKKLLPKETIVAKKLEAYAGLLHEAGEKANKKKLEQAWSEIPKKLRKELHILEVYTREKLKFADTADCEPLLRTAIKHKWDKEIVSLYGLVQGKDPVKQLLFAESLQTGHARDPVLLLTLGRLSMRNSLWGKAAAYLKESIQINPMPESYRELAILLEKQGDYSAASSYYQQGLTLATSVVKHDAVKLLEQAEEQDAVTAGARQVV
jgi:HemY protein